MRWSDRARGGAGLRSDGGGGTGRSICNLGVSGPTFGCTLVEPTGTPRPRPRLGRQPHVRREGSGLGRTPRDKTRRVRVVTTINLHTHHPRDETRPGPPLLSRDEPRDKGCYCRCRANLFANDPRSGTVSLTGRVTQEYSRMPTTLAPGRPRAEASWRVGSRRGPCTGTGAFPGRSEGRQTEDTGLRGEPYS